MALNAKQVKFMKALLMSDTITEAYKQAGIAEHTAYKYLADEEFNKEYTEQKRASLRHVSTRLNEIALRSIAILDEIANDEEQTGASRIRAVEVALNYAYKGMELEDLNNRLTEIENMLEEAEEGS